MEEYPGELADLRKLRSLIKHNVLAEKMSGVYFISGQLGHIDVNGLPDRIMVCPAYGASWSQIYEKTERTV
jgi:hypothetical protein